MPRPKKSRGVTEKERFEVILEDIQGKLQLLSEGQAGIRGEIEQGFGQLRSEMTQRFAIVEQALKELHQEVRAIGQRVTVHDETHAR